jgi:16S rRNA (adenine1518-N6/adenine1519-N6)-dimethyltransferase
VRKIVKTAGVKPGDRVLEIGPGPGALTSELLSAGALVHAVEVDHKFASKLPRFQTPDHKLFVHENDFLNFPLAEFSYLKPLKVVANLPYHITSPILAKLCEFSAFFSSATVMVQKEVAERITARAGTTQVSSFTVFLEYYATVSDSFKVTTSCFYPRPKVDSSVIRLDFHQQPMLNADHLFSVVRQAFQQKRKMITTSLQSLFPIEKIKKALLKADASLTCRPETLTLNQWITFVTSLNEICD